MVSFYPACSTDMDLGFLIDSSYNMRQTGKGAFSLLSRYIARILYSLRISSQRTRVSMVTYASKARLVFPFNRYSRVSNMIAALRRIPLQRGSLNLGTALYYASTNIFTGRRRCGRKRVLVVFVSGRSRDRVERAARALKRIGVEVFVVGIGRGVTRKELIKIATNGVHVFTTSLRTLSAVLYTIRNKACSGIVYLPLMLVNTYFSHQRQIFIHKQMGNTQFKILVFKWLFFGRHNRQFPKLPALLE